MAPGPSALEKEETLPSVPRAVRLAIPHPTKKISTTVSQSLLRGEEANAIEC